ncbi:hypothetical protein QE152_g13775 [Popillia japonica]|uniref:Uncharacterized protein n=1 Tax=Popillia japonica TaxID=7064 RepID=A0AAW1LAY7_POPJA
MSRSCRSVLPSTPCGWSGPTDRGGQVALAAVGGRRDEARSDQTPADVDVEVVCPKLGCAAVKHSTHAGELNRKVACTSFYSSNSCHEDVPRQELYFSNENLEQPEIPYSNLGPEETI